MFVYLRRPGVAAPPLLATLLALGACEHLRGSSNRSRDMSLDASTAQPVDCEDGQMPAICPSPLPENIGCQSSEDCGSSASGNGLDDDCNGMVDDTCSCTPGAVQRCFSGPPGKRNIGACTDGTQTCDGAGEFGIWGPCVGGIAPAPES